MEIGTKSTVSGGLNHLVLDFVTRFLTFDYDNISKSTRNSSHKRFRLMDRECTKRASLLQKNILGNQIGRFSDRYPTIHDYALR